MPWISQIGHTFIFITKHESVSQFSYVSQLVCEISSCFLEASLKQQYGGVFPHTFGISSILGQQQKTSLHFTFPLMTSAVCTCNAAALYYT